MTSWQRAGAAALVLTAGLAATPIAARAQTVFKLGVATDALTLDPIATSDNPSIWSQLQIYDTLVRPKPDGKALEADLAQSWQAGADGRSYTFHLRPDAQFSDGTPVTAADVVASLKRAASPKSQWARFFQPIAGMQATDAHTVTLTLKQPFTPLLNNLGLFSAAILPAAEANAAKLPDMPLGSGPFVVKEWRHGERMVLVRNPHYWDHGKPYVDEADLIVIGEDNSRVLQLESGAIDAMINVPYNQMSRLKASPALRVGSAQVFRADFVMLNTKRKPFDDLRVRQALNYAVDKQGLVRGVLFGNGEVAADAMPVMAWHDASLKPYPFDLAKAKALLQQAGLGAGFSTAMLVPAGDAAAGQVAAAVQSNLAAIGVKVALQQIETGTQWDVTKKGDYQMSISYATSDTIDPDQLFGFLAVNPERADAYHTFWQSTKLNDLYAQERTTPEGPARGKMFQQMEALLHDGAPYIFLYRPTTTYAYRTRVTGFAVLPTSNWRLQDVKLAH
ncbi:MAG TPA: ABC transporter substrate-binding protein [Acetobacteraceae bacterium]|nr:ABC transporter substrate-binding protein [Acetobacteraceae bacterium]